MNQQNNNLYFLKHLYYNVKKEDRGMKIMVNLLNMRLCMFGSFNHIKATGENITKIMEKISDIDLLPSTIALQNIDILNNKIEAVTKISFTTPDKKINFVILDDRIEINYNSFNDSEQNIHEIENIKSMALNIINILFKCFEIKSNRLALNCQFLGGKITDIDENCRKHVKCPNFYQSKKVIEWTSRINTRDIIKISEKMESINIITELSSANNVYNDEARLLGLLDINTVAENNEFRFDTFEELEEFSNDAIEIAETILNDYLEE